jgi:hypothetical protein
LAGRFTLPDGDFGGVAEVLDGFGAAEDDSVVGWDGGGEVVVAVCVSHDVRIGALVDEGVDIAYGWRC